MSVSFSEEREQLRVVMREFLADAAPEAAVRSSMTTETGWDPAVWGALAEEIGVLGLGIPEEFGGSGYGIAEIAVISEEAGRALLCAPYLAIVSASQAVLATGDREAAAALLPGVAAGSTIATLAVTESDGRLAPESVSTTAVRDGDGWRLTGTKMFVLDGAAADLILVAARTEDGISLFAVDGDAPGLRRTALATLDQTRRARRRRRNWRWSRASPRHSAPMPTCTPPRRTSRSTAGSGSPGSTPPTCTSSGRRAPGCCSAIRRTTASWSHSSSERTGAGPARRGQGRVSAWRRPDPPASPAAGPGSRARGRRTRAGRPTTAGR
ncbi:hypothetical protein FAGKG844_270018 [Frankia sp. AgKG'84/4]